jgi:hypothetical protein
MALEFICGIDQYTSTTDLGLKFGFQTGVNSIETTTGRFGGHCVNLGINDRFAYSFTSAATMLCGGAYIHEPASWGSNADIIAFVDGTTVQVQVEYAIGGFIRVRLATSGVILATSTNPVVKQNKWHWIEVQITISNTVGQITIDVDGINAINTAANLDTQTSASATCDEIRFTSGGSDGRWDDIYIATPTGGQITSFIGDAQIDNIMPDGAGNYTEFGAETPGASTHWQNCDEIGPDGDSTKITSTAVNQRDTFTHANLAAITTQTIHAVQQTAYAKHDGTATNFRLVHRRTTDNNGASQAGGASYGYFREVWEQDQDAGPGAWTETNVNASEGGVESL